MSNTCPKCGVDNPEGATACIRCGVIFAKIKPVPPPDERAPASERTAECSPQTVELEISYVAAKTLLLAAMALYSFRLLSHPIASNFAGESFLHIVNLPFHEAGHVIFAPFGRLIQAMVGTLGQLIIPAIVVVSFFLRRDYFATSVGLWWLLHTEMHPFPFHLHQLC